MSTRNAGEKEGDSPRRPTRMLQKFSKRGKGGGDRLEFVSKGGGGVGVSGILSANVGRGEKWGSSL